MKITIWSDFVCPFCYIGEAPLKEALETFKHASEVEIEYKSFLLMPDAEYIPGKNYAETFSKLKNMPLDQAKSMHEQVESMANKSDIDINFDIAKLAGTYDAHRAFQYAKEQGKGNEFFQRFYAAHFTEGELISDLDTIVRLSEEVGLPGDEVRKLVENKDHTEKVQQEITEASSVGVQGVPFFVFDNKYSVSGAQPAEAFRQVLDQVWEKEHK